MEIAPAPTAVLLGRTHQPTRGQGRLSADFFRRLQCRDAGARGAPVSGCTRRPGKAHRGIWLFLRYLDDLFGNSGTRQLLRSVRPGRNIHSFRREVAPFFEYVRTGSNGFVSSTLNISDGIEVSECVPNQRGLPASEASDLIDCAVPSIIT